MDPEIKGDHVRPPKIGKPNQGSQMLASDSLGVSSIKYHPPDRRLPYVFADLGFLTARARQNVTTSTGVSVVEAPFFGAFKGISTIFVEE